MNYNQGQESKMEAFTRARVGAVYGGTVRGPSNVELPVPTPTFEALCVDIHNEISAIADRHSVVIRAIRRLRNPRPANECETAGCSEKERGNTLEFNLKLILQRLGHLRAESTEIADELNAVI